MLFNKLSIMYLKKKQLSYRQLIDDIDNYFISRFFFYNFQYFIFSHYFADLTSPLLIAAQTALIQQVRDRQSSLSQPHFDAAVATLGRPIHPDDFYTVRPDKLFSLTTRKGETAVRIRSASSLGVSARLDPKGTDYYARKLNFRFYFHLSYF